MRCLLLCVCLLLPLFALDLTLHCADFSIPETLVPDMNNKAVEDRICQFIFDSLVVQKNEEEYVLSLAEEVDASPDSLSYTFLLRDNIKWQDGTILTARDIEFTLETLLNPQSDTYSSVLSTFIDDVTFVNPKIVTITLTRPFYDPLSLFTFKVLPKHIFQKNFLKKEDLFATNPIGCGPFIYKEGLGTKTITLIANKYFNYRSKPYFQKIVFKIYDEIENAYSDLENKKLHVIPNIWDKQEKNKNIQFVPCSSQEIHLLNFNYDLKHSHHKILSNRSFRIALLQAIDRENIASDFFLSKNIHFISAPFPYKSWFYNQNIQTVRYSFSNAKQAVDKTLLESGYLQNAEGFWHIDNELMELKLFYKENNPKIKRIVERIVAIIEKLGIHVKLVSVLQQKKDYDLYYQQFSFKNTANLFELFSLQDIASEKYKNPHLSELLYELYATLTPWGIQEISYKIHDFVNTQSVFIFLWQLNSYVAYNNMVKNIQTHPRYAFNFPEQWKFSNNQ